MEEMSLDNLKSKAVKEALHYIHRKYLPTPRPIYIGAGSGSTAKKAFPALSKYKGLIAIPTSKETESQLLALGIKVKKEDEVKKIEFDIDGADEVDPSLTLIKGGWGHHTQEKKVAKKSRELIIVVDETKLVDYLGQRSPIPVEVEDKKTKAVMEELKDLGPVEIRKADSKEFKTDQGTKILDLTLLSVYQGAKAAELERKINRIDGVIDNGIFATRKADIVFVGTPKGVRTLT